MRKMHYNYYKKKKDHVRKPDNTCNQTGASPLQVFRHPQLGEKK